MAVVLRHVGAGQPGGAVTAVSALMVFEDHRYRPSRTTLPTLSASYTHTAVLLYSDLTLLSLVCIAASNKASTAHSTATGGHTSS
jgi:hypothetical protein